MTAQLVGPGGTIDVSDRAARLLGHVTIDGVVTLPPSVEVSNDAGNPLPVNGTVALDAATLAALEVVGAVVTGTVGVNNFPASVAVSGPLTDAQLRASAVAVTFPADEAGLTDAELRASPVPVTGPLTDAQLRALPVGVTGPLTDAQLRAATVPVNGTVGVNNFPASVAVSGTVTANLGTIDGVSTETSLAAAAADLARKFRPGVRTTAAGTASAVGDNVLVTPAPGMRVRLYWVGLSTSQDNAGENLAVLRFGAGPAKYRWRMGNPGAFSHWEVLTGAPGEALVLVLSTTDAVEWNVTWEEVA